MILTKLDSATGLLAPSTTDSSKALETTALALDSHMPEIAMVAIKIYAFGGLAFMVGVVLTAVSYWIWTVLIRREYADSPPSLELHPERMRAREKARVLRLNMRKEKKKHIGHEQEGTQETFTPPPVRYYTTRTRNRGTSLPVKPALRDSIQDKPKPLSPGDSQSNNRGCGKRVSWASTLTLNDSKDIEKNLNDAPTPLNSLSLASGTLIAPVPRAQTYVPRLSTSIEMRSRRGQEMIDLGGPSVRAVQPTGKGELPRRFTSSGLNGDT
ncbi:hypothetical protein CVT24_005390 [Panaeolus cyanescens]|uniref:Uncharacterized protein n=1 Tax=Panaeolus cyanescens TaxID=181874 RepID=A0A409VQZ5_9AGAR|nr:hypothetical protein CVT24_005390 [Panaeolus cyanescens]